MGALLSALKKMSVMPDMRDWKKWKKLLAAEAIPASSSASLVRQNGSRYDL